MKTAVPEPYWNREDMTADIQAHTLDHHKCWIRGNDEILPHLPAFSSSMTKRLASVTQNTRWPWESVGTDIFTINNKHYLCIVDYHDILLRLSRPHKGCFNDDCNHFALINRAPNKLRCWYLQIYSFSVYRVSCSGTERRWRTVDAWKWWGMEQMTTMAEARKYKWWKLDAWSPGWRDIWGPSQYRQKVTSGEKCPNPMDYIQMISSVNL